MILRSSPRRRSCAPPRHVSIPRRRPCAGWRRWEARHSRGHPERDRAGDPRECGARVARDAASGAGMGVHEPHGAADRDRGWEPLDRGRRRHHGAHPQDSSRDRCLPRERIHRRGDPRGPRRVRGRLASQRGGRVMTRRTWAIAVLGAWAASLGWLVKREFFRPTGTRLAEAALSVPPGAVYYRLDVAGQQVGFASSTIDTQATSIAVTDILVLRVPALGVLHRTAAMSRATLSRTLRLERVDARFEGDMGRFAARSLVAGDTLLTVTLLAGPDSQTTHVPLARPIVLPTLLPLRLAFGGELKRGKTYASVVFDPILLAERPVTVLVAAESTLVVADSAGYDSTALAWVPARFDTVRAFRIDQREDGMTTRAWIDAQGHIVRAENAVGFAMERTAFEIAYTTFRHRDTTNLIHASLSPGPGEVVATTVLAARELLPHDTASQLRVRLTGVTPGAFDLGGGRQQQSGDTLLIRREPRATLSARYQLPARDSI